MMDYDPANCAIGAAMEIVGERSTFLVLREAFNGVRRFADMRRGPASPAGTERPAGPPGQRGLLREGPYQDTGQRRGTRPAHREGPGLYPVLVRLLQWGDLYGSAPEGPPVLLRHRDCGQPVRSQLACEARHVLDSARDVASVPGPGARKIA